MAGGGEWLSIEELADLLGVSVKTVRAWRYRKTAPRGAVFGRHVRFRKSDVDAWIEAQMDPSPSGTPMRC